MGEQVFFDLATIALLSSEKRASLRVQLSRWCKTGRLISLRRGFYGFPEKRPWIKINPAVLANKLYAPSYISSYWALGFFGLIPERVVTYTSVTRRVTRTFENPLGVFRYQSVKPEAFFGYKLREIDRAGVLLADPEKALLDLWYLETGLWDEARMEGMRFQNKQLIDPGVLKDYAQRYHSPRILRAADLWMAMTDEESEAVTL